MGCPVGGWAVEFMWRGAEVCWESLGQNSRERCGPAGWSARLCSHCRSTDTASLDDDRAGGQRSIRDSAADSWMDRGAVGREERERGWTATLTDSNTGLTAEAVTHSRGA